MLLLHIEEPRESWRGDHRVRLGRMDAGYERLGNAVEHLTTETPGHERLETLVLRLTIPDRGGLGRPWRGLVLPTREAENRGVSESVTAR